MRLEEEALYKGGNVLSLLILMISNKDNIIVNPCLYYSVKGKDDTVALTKVNFYFIRTICHIKII